MLELDDNALLKEYVVEHSSEKAFATLVARHVNKVYSIALRHTRAMRIKPRKSRGRSSLSWQKNPGSWANESSSPVGCVELRGCQR